MRNEATNPQGFGRENVSQSHQPATLDMQMVILEWAKDADKRYAGLERDGAGLRLRLPALHEGVAALRLLEGGDRIQILLRIVED